jgi:arylsulfatase
MRSSLLLFLAFLGLTLRAAPDAQTAARPNIVLILTDDQGYGDVGCFGEEDFATPNLDRLAKEGTRFTNFLVAQPVCTASRAALLSGCYSNRVGMTGALNHTSRTGIHPDEMLLPELCSAKGYATACFGKWHLGTAKRFFPTRNGFDEWAGIPYSNDNGPLHPTIRDLPPLPFYEGDKVAELDPDQSQFTERLTALAIRFVEANKNRPFFLYLPHIMPHVPIFASKKSAGPSRRGLYGDVIQELDAGIGELLDTIDRLGLRDRTLVIFASDNGPFLSYGEHAGSAGALRGGKLTCFEGGVRVPCIMRWPGRIPAGRVADGFVTALDILPTVAGLLGAPLPSHKIDGIDVWDYLSGKSDRSPRERFLYYNGSELHAVREGDWKLHLEHDYLEVAGERGRGGKPSNWGKMSPLSITESGIRGIASRHGYAVRHIGLSLYNLREDIGETCDVAAAHPGIVAKLKALADEARRELGDSITGARGAGLRECAQEP